MRRLLFAIMTVFAVVTITFFLMKAIPGDPFNEAPEEIHKMLRKHYGLEAPLHEQYLQYLWSVATWDLGPSIKYHGRTVNDIIKQSFPVSLILGLEALFLAVGAGILAGSFSARSQNTWISQGTLILCTIGVSIPNFAVATLLQYFLAFKLELFPVARWGSFSQSILPALSLSLMPMAFITRLVRVNMMRVLREPYVKVAKAKGLSDSAVLFRHVLKNSIHPLWGYLGQLTGNILVGSFVIEKIFAIPGLGQWFVNSILNRDYTAIMGLTVFYCVILITSVTLFDLIASMLDPRIRLKKVSFRRYFT